MDNCASSYHRFLEEDNSALEEIVDLYNKKLILFLNTFVTNLAVGEDLAADTFLELILKKPRFNQESSFQLAISTRCWPQRLRNPTFVH